MDALREGPFARNAQRLSFTLHARTGKAATTLRGAAFFSARCPSEKRFLHGRRGKSSGPSAYSKTQKPHPRGRPRNAGEEFHAESREISDARLRPDKPARTTSRHGRKVPRTHFDRKGAPLEVSPLQALQKGSGNRFKFGVRLCSMLQIAGERLFTTDALTLSARQHGSVVDPAHELVEDRTGSAKLFRKKCERHAAHVCTQIEAFRTKFRSRCRSHPPQSLNRELVYEGLGSIRVDRAEAVRLSPIACDLREELVVGNAGTCNKSQLPPNVRLDATGNFSTLSDPKLVGRNVEIRLVERQGLNQIRITAENCVDLAGYLSIVLQSGFNENQIRTKRFCFRTRHGASDAVSAGFVACGCDNPPPLGMADGNRTTAKSRIVALLNRGIKRIHVDVDDAAGKIIRKHRILHDVHSTASSKSLALLGYSERAASSYNRAFVSHTQTGDFMRIVIVGGVAAGIGTAVRIKRLCPQTEVVVFERGERIAFANCALPYYAAGRMTPGSSLYAVESDRLRREQGVDVRERHEVVAVDRAKKCVTVRNLETDETFEVSYDKLVLATGAAARILPIEGLSECAHPMWRPEDADQLAAALRANPNLVVGVIGGGAVGLETAENVVELGGTVHLMEYGRTIMGRNDPALSTAFRRWASASHPRMVFHMETSVTKAHKTEDCIELTLSDGTILSVDYLVSAAGVAPRSELAAQAGLPLGPRGTILVDRHMRTEDPNVYAVGDVAVSHDPLTGEQRPMMLAATAVKEARACAEHIAAAFEAKPLAGGFGTNAVSFFGLLWASTGKNEQTLLNEGLRRRRDFFSATAMRANHVGWYPGSTPLLLKVLFDKTGKVLGAQAIGRDGADKRIDVISTAMRFGATVEDLSQLDLCYAPQTGLPKDPVNTCGHIGENILNDLVRFIEPDELRALLAGETPDLGDGVPNTPENLTVLDVREAHELAKTPFVAPVKHIPLGELRERCEELSDKKTIAVLCRRGVRAYTAARILEEAGFDNVFVITGGMEYWSLTAPETKAD